MKKLRFKPSFQDQRRANKAALDFYAAASGRETPKEQAALHADVRDKVSRPRKARTTGLLATEAEVQRAIIGYLCGHPRVALVERHNSGAVHDAQKGYYIEFHHLYSRGFKGEKMRKPDICGMLRDGRYYAIEVKRQGWRKPSDQREIEQENYLLHVRACGGIALFATCVDDVGAVL